MHIAFLTSEYPHPKVAHAAGIGTSIKNLVDALVEKKIKVTVFVYGQISNDFFKENGIDFYLIKHQKHQFGTWFFYRKNIQNFINKIIKNNKIDILEAPDWTGITAFMNFKIPLIIRFHGSDAYFCHLEKRKQKIKNFWFEKLALKNAKAYIAPTDFAGKLSQKIFNLNSKKIKIIHNGIQLKYFENSNPYVFQKGLVLYIGTIIRKKGVLELPKIFECVLKQFPDATLLLIGADANDIVTNSLSTWQLFQEKSNAELLKNVQYLGKIPYKEIQSYIQKANVCVFPTFAETLGMVTVESMAMQKAIVTSDFGWTNEIIINNESGFLINPKKHQDFANAIIDILKNDDFALQTGVNARIRVEEIFDINKIVQQNIDFYQSFI